MRAFAIAAAALLVALSDSDAQSATDPVYARAQALVSEGQGAAGRALVDSMYRATAPGSGERAEALFWRASLAPTAADAERDYRAIVVDHATSSRVEDALLRLAQLELARGDRDGALGHLRRLATEFPGSGHSARTSYWTARVLFERNDLAAACASNAQALARVGANDVELRNQIEYQQQRCRGDVTAAPPPVAPPSAPRDAAPSIPVSAPVLQPAASTTPAARTFSVQVAATNTRAGAQTIVNRMSARGYQARIDGTAAPFRVRVGRYDTRAAAARLLTEMEAKGIDGFIAIIEGR